ncbi:MAG: hypothetical protein ACI4QZ_07565 [Eubacteriales bacterium]
MKLKDKFARFMYGRYGIDELSRLMTVLFYLLIIINLFVRSSIISVIALILVFLFTFRSFSRNIYKRRQENNRYLRLKKRVKDFFTLEKNRFRDRKTHIYRKCPKCRAVLRLPKEKGKHTVRCPRCGGGFDIKV